jgi:hypothetical protein
VWLPIEIDEENKSLKVVWHDIYDLNVYVHPSKVQTADTDRVVGKLVNGSLSRERLTQPARLSSLEMHSSRKL